MAEMRPKRRLDATRGVGGNQGAVQRGNTSRHSRGTSSASSNTSSTHLVCSAILSLQRPVALQRLFECSRDGMGDDAEGQSAVVDYKEAVIGRIQWREGSEKRASA